MNLLTLTFLPTLCSFLLTVIIYLFLSHLHTLSLKFLMCVWPSNSLPLSLHYIFFGKDEVSFRIITCYNILVPFSFLSVYFAVTMTTFFSYRYPLLNLFLTLVTLVFYAPVFPFPSHFHLTYLSVSCFYTYLTFEMQVNFFISLVVILFEPVFPFLSHLT